MGCVGGFGWLILDVFDGYGGSWCVYWILRSVWCWMGNVDSLFNAIKDVMAGRLIL